MIIGPAGHIDHGQAVLMKAPTGIDAALLVVAPDDGAGLGITGTLVAGR